MKARDVMSSEVVSVRPDEPAHKVAQLLLDKHISAVPVVDDRGEPLGIVSEGDLIGRDETEREARRDWWLEMLAEGEALNPEFVAGLRKSQRTARDLMSAPVVTVGEETEVGEIARVLTTYRIKRVPVVRDGRLVGVVSRADLLRVLAQEQASSATPPGGGRLAGAIAGLEERFEHFRHSDKPASAGAGRAPNDARPEATDFQHLVLDFEHKELQHREEARRIAAEQRRTRLTELIDQHISDQGWRGLLHQARQAAEQGQMEFLLLRFPSQVCSDGGRAINVNEAGWPSTLRGEAGEIYLRWEQDLKPCGFHLAARILEFPGGMPGDVGLFLAWGQ